MAISLGSEEASIAGKPHFVHVADVSLDRLMALRRTATDDSMLDALIGGNAGGLQFLATAARST